MTIEVTIKKWGNSFGVILPKEVIKKEGLKENKKILIDVVKEADLSDIFGSLKGKIRISGQKMKDLSRKEWEK
ncbi:MAG: AbrB/MazE/SpoVT family DNA-binding domain-containing protein [Nanoarchaeota archaeon]